MPFWRISACALAMRDRRSSLPIGSAPSRIERMLASSASTVDPPTPWVICSASAASVGVVDIRLCTRTAREYLRDAGDKSLGRLDGGRSPSRRDGRNGAGLVVDRRFEVVGTPEERSQPRIDTR